MGWPQAKSPQGFHGCHQSSVSPTAPRRSARGNRLVLMIFLDSRDFVSFFLFFILFLFSFTNHLKWMNCPCLISMPLTHKTNQGWNWNKIKELRYPCGCIDFTLWVSIWRKIKHNHWSHHLFQYVFELDFYTITGYMLFWLVWVWVMCPDHGWNKEMHESVVGCQIWGAEESLLLFSTIANIHARCNRTYSSLRNHPNDLRFKVLYLWPCQCSNSFWNQS